MQAIDFIVYYKSRQALPEGGYRIITTPTALRVRASIRRRIAAIPDLAWVCIYDRLYGGRLPYSTGPLPDASECFYIKYGDRTHADRLQSSRLLVVHRKSGEIFYQGSANDEGCRCGSARYPVSGIFAAHHKN